MICVILTANQARVLRGAYSATQALDPVELADGSFALPARCLIDFAAARGKDAAQVLTLLARTRRDLAAADFKHAAEIDVDAFTKVTTDEAARFENLVSGLPTVKRAGGASRIADGKLDP